MKKLFNVREVARQLGVAPTTVYAMCQRKQILHRRVGAGRGTIRIPAEALAAYMARATVTPDTTGQATGESECLAQTVSCRSR